MTVHNTDKPLVCILRIEGTNCEEETARGVRMAGGEAEHVHLKQLEHHSDIRPGQWRSLEDYQALVIPGGFCAGDSVRAGAILAARMRSALGEPLRRFVESGRPVGGICNGFQVLVELGLLPAFDGIMSEQAEAVLFTNRRPRFECRPVLLKKVNRGSCPWVAQVPDEPVLIPVAHGEGDFTAPPGKEEEFVRRLEENDQIVFRYVKDDGSPANGEYPYNPNGSLADIAGICNRQGNVMGLMPHPERVVHPYLLHDWTRRQRPAAGLPFFRSLVAYAAKFPIKAQGGAMG